MEIINCEQRSPDWFRHRSGIVTASMMKTVMASGKDGGDSKTRTKYLYQLAGEILTGEPCPSYSNENMERGNTMEAEARNAYALIHGHDLTQVGFIKRTYTIEGRTRTIGCSPDSLIGSAGILEIKTQDADLLIARLLAGGSAPEHLAQLQGNLWVTERQWIDLSIYWPKLPEFRRRFRRDDLYIRKLEIAVDVFYSDLEQIVDKIRRYRDPSTIIAAG